MYTINLIISYAIYMITYLKYNNIIMLSSYFDSRSRLLIKFSLLHAIYMITYLKLYNIIMLSSYFYRRSRLLNKFSLLHVNHIITLKSFSIKL